MGRMNTSPPSADMMSRSISAKFLIISAVREIESGRLSDESDGPRTDRRLMFNGSRRSLN
jgi:hypothetical protein